MREHRFQYKVNCYYIDSNVIVFTDIILAVTNVGKHKKKSRFII